MSDSLNIVCIDDDPDIISWLEHHFTGTRHNIISFSTGEKGLEYLKDNNDVDLLLLDYNLGEENGLDVLENVKSQIPELTVVMLTSFSDIDIVVKSVKLGASDYILKPLEFDFLLTKIESIGNLNSIQKENKFLKKQLADKYKFDNLIGLSPPMQKVFEIISKVSDRENTVLIQGESGTGKELIAKAIHFSGNRADKMFIPIDCGAISPNLIESELFGHVKGAFTGAHQKKEGLMISAGYGTLFFDEIGELPLEMQTKFLRAIQEKEVRPVGGTSPEKIHARIVAATNKNLLEAVENGQFRVDLFYRLNVIFIEVAPLRERIEDITVLVKHFIDKYNSGSRLINEVDENAMEALKNYSWPGNVRELENCIERAFVLGEGNILRYRDLPGTVINVENMGTPSDPIRRTLEDYEKEAILKTLSFTGGNKREAARILKIGKSTLYNKMEKFRLK